VVKLYPSAWALLRGLRARKDEKCAFDNASD